MSGPIFLCGMMGSGKTSVGIALAEVLACPLIDLDVRIERMFGASIGELFEQGEPMFRERERDALSSLLAEPAFARRRTVVATGGGIVIDPRNRSDMDGAGTRVLLDVPLDNLARRLSKRAQIEARPLLHTGEALHARLIELWDRRAEAYRGGAIVVDASSAVSEVVASVLDALDLAPQNGETATA